MPKKISKIYHKVYNLDNIELADQKARKGKSKSYGVKRHDLHKTEENFSLMSDLITGNYKTSEYDKFRIFEPKERIIYRLPYFPDRICHHAIMNIMEDIWVKIFTRDTYSCIKNRGIHALANKLRQDLRNNQEETIYCLKLDIKKFYPSIDNSILKQIIRKKIKDEDLLKLLDEIIDSEKGVPIGNYLSQYFANLYLAYFDHWVKEELKVKYYYRYADDIVILCSSKEQLRSWFLAIKIYLHYVLNLQVKGNYQIFPVESRGIDFVGYVFYHNYVRLRKSMKIKMKRLIHKYQINKISREDFRKRMVSYIGWLKYCDSKHFIQEVLNPVGIQCHVWNGKAIYRSQIQSKYVYLTTVTLKPKYYMLHFKRNGKPYTIKSSDKRLFYNVLSRKSLPLAIKIE